MQACMCAIIYDSCAYEFFTTDLLFPILDVADGFEVTPATIAVEEGDDAFFYCGNEVSNAVWRLPNGIELGPEPGPAGSRIQAQYRLLELKPVMRGDEGTYTCFERNGQQRSATAMLAVNSEYYY